MKTIRKILCVCLVITVIMAMSVPALAARGAKDGTGPNPIHQKLKDGTGCGGIGGGGKGGGGGLRDGSGNNPNCPYLP